MALSGSPGGVPIVAAAPLASCAEGALAALGWLAGERWSAEIDAGALLGERAAIANLSRHGDRSAGGSCRLLRARDAWIAVNLARLEDLQLLPAWLGEGDATDPWGFVAERAARWPAAELVERGRLLGIPLAEARPPEPDSSPWHRTFARGPTAPRSTQEVPLVVDLTSMWAGPLCTHLLALAGARVVKVESTGRPDGARNGPSEFFDLLNAGKESVALDFACNRARRQLDALVSAADIVVESSRPRALAQLGIRAAELVSANPGKTWVSITGYGRTEPEASWVAFGDDAAVAAGLAWPQGSEVPLFVGDAIADPLTGLHAAVAALAVWRQGGGRGIALALRDVVAQIVQLGAPPAKVLRGGNGWEVSVDGERQSVLAPRARPRFARARALGADTESVLSEFAGSW